MEELHVFRGDGDWVVAESEEDAWDVWCSDMGESREDYEHMQWEQEPDHKLLTIWSDEDNKTCGCRAKLEEYDAEIERKEAILSRMPPEAARRLRPGLPKRPATHPNGHLVDCPVGSQTLTCAEWARNGRGFLCSTEF